MVCGLFCVCRRRWHTPKGIRPCQDQSLHLAQILWSMDEVQPTIQQGCVHKLGLACRVLNITNQYISYWPHLVVQSCAMSMHILCVLNKHQGHKAVCGDCIVLTCAQCKIE